jgi:signal transduction histidine kinase
MKLLIALYFFLLAIIQLGLFFGIYHYFRSKNTLKPNTYWMGSLLTSVLALFIFGFGIVSIDDIAKPKFNFTIGNAFFYVAAVLQALFCHSLNQPVSRFQKMSLSLSVMAFLIVFEWMRIEANFEIRTSFMCIVASIFYVWQIYEIQIKRKREPSSQLSYLQYASSAELFFALGRLTILVIYSLTIRQVEQIPQVLILFTVIQLVMNTLSYIAIGGYWTEQIAIKNAKSQIENEEISALLKEREALINSLMASNKSAAAGAMSASLAHEINQPISASRVNLFTLRRYLANKETNVQSIEQLVGDMEFDNKRAGDIVASLRSIFNQQEIAVQKVSLFDAVESIVSLTRGELNLDSIKLHLNVPQQLWVQSNMVELQQVLLNLLNNAIDALKRFDSVNKSIWISAIQNSDEEVELRVADSGPGVPGEFTKSMFDLFATQKKTGMGVGLWLCQYILSRCGGKICYEPREGGGSTFIVTMKSA